MSLSIVPVQRSPPCHLTVAIAVVGGVLEQAADDLNKRPQAVRTEALRGFDAEFREVVRVETGQFMGGDVQNRGVAGAGGGDVEVLPRHLLSDQGVDLWTLDAGDLLISTIPLRILAKAMASLAGDVQSEISQLRLNDLWLVFLKVREQVFGAVERSLIEMCSVPRAGW